MENYISVYRTDSRAVHSFRHAGKCVTLCGRTGLLSAERQSLAYMHAFELILILILFYVWNGSCLISR